MLSVWELSFMTCCVRIQLISYVFTSLLISYNCGGFKLLADSLFGSKIVDHHYPVEEEKVCIFRLLESSRERSPSSSPLYRGLGPSWQKPCLPSALPSKTAGRGSGFGGPLISSVYQIFSIHSLQFQNFSFLEKLKSFEFIEL